MTKILSIGTAVPPFVLNQKLADALLTEHYKDALTKRGLDVLHSILSHPSILKRHIAVSDHRELISLKKETMDIRMKRFTHWAVNLSKNAILRALEKAGKPLSAIKALVVNTCTGYICPGISTYLLEALSLPNHTRVFDLVGSGCGGAAPNLQVGKAILKDLDADEDLVVCVSVEICSATFEMANDMSLLVSNCIFGDGAAAAVLSSKGPGLELLELDSYYDPHHRNDVRYVYKNERLHNQLAPKLPDILGEKVPPLIKNTLSKYDLNPDHIHFWAIHPGGDKILSTIQSKLELSDKKMKYAKGVLSDYGNMSSPSILFELRRIFDDKPEHQDWCLFTTFGAGLSAFSCLGRFSDSP